MTREKRVRTTPELTIPEKKRKILESDRVDIDALLQLFVTNNAQYALSATYYLDKIGTDKPSGILVIGHAGNKLSDAELQIMGAFAASIGEHFQYIVVIAKDGKSEDQIFYRMWPRDERLHS